jgi:O-antigen ligase
MRLIFVLFFPLLGIFDFCRGQGLSNLGFTIFVGPIFLVLATQLIIKPLMNNKLIPLGLSRKIGTSESFYLKVLTFFIIIMLVGILRAVSVGTRDVFFGLGEVIIISSIFVFLLVVMVDAIRKNYFDSMMYFMGISLFGLLFLNILGVTVGITNLGITENYNNEVVNSFKFMNDRIKFPFMISGQLLSIQAGVVMLVGVFRVITAANHFHRILGMLMMLSAAFVLIGNGSRGAILITFGALLFTAFRGLSRPFLLPVLTLFLLFPLLVLLDIGVIVEHAFDMARIEFSRNEGDVASFSNRDIIYASTIAAFVAQGDIMSMLFGYGSYGQVTSGISDSYTFLFSNSYSDPYSMHVHNSILQILIDYGVLGISLFVFLVFKLTRLSKNTALYKRKLGERHKNNNFYMTLLLFIIGTSMTEVSLTYYSFGGLSIFLMLAMLIIFDRVNFIFRKSKPH